ncbi:bifunctional aspartate kinase/homoserine dehydrogenase I [Buchnera aphidicola (Thelaxes californica)]|uniref:Bifunctional aspartokinase/homoserine dehydrogenase n=1 Tax=Buchnera aphidicola (Thelaxes californica) TaxID=1315998 RepID=A0A4D6YNS8_9GAMM|nr:bifunctional aspartate kinase/homoserine dehydrogenase I [Buchnera aphidicola]QCI26705.1 bifunctional aspartate kinase/homoserine dehydrogenase I [Buchnera aphidicola (Thelaxes californica)]
MKILKFGGSSLANAKLFLLVSNIILKKKEEMQIAVVLSAPKKITNYLIDAIEKSIINNQFQHEIHEIQQIFYLLIKELFDKNNTFPYKIIEQKIQNELNHITRMLKAISVLQQCPDKIKAIIISKGEILSIIIMEGIFKMLKYPTVIINPQKEIITNDDYLNATVNIKKTKNNIQALTIQKQSIILMPGFIASNQKGEIVVLGRDGSDYSAAILSVCLNACSCEIWTDVNGVYSYDPRIIHSAQQLKSLSYSEATILSYLGAKVLHPKTIFPLEKNNINCIIKNTFDQYASGTIISHQSNDTNNIKGIAELNDFSLIYIQIKKNENIKQTIHSLQNISQKLNSNIFSFVELTENYELHICIKKKFLEKICQKIKKIHCVKTNKNNFFIKKIINNISIISIVGNIQLLQKKIVPKLYKIFENEKKQCIYNIFYSSQQSLSVLLKKIEKKNIYIKKIDKLHNFIFNHYKKYIEIFLIGIGGIGKTLLQQIAQQKKILQKKNIFIKLCSIANSKKSVMNNEGINLNHYKLEINKSTEKFNFDQLKQFIIENNCSHPILVDCTSSQFISEKYIECINYGMHIVTANKKANTSNYSYYLNIRKETQKNKKHFFYETNVGAGLPIIENFKNLLLSGDKLIQFKGILSGSLSFIFGKLEENIKFSEATMQAMHAGLTEPDPREDLSGIDVARKLLILAREAGYHLELKDIKIESILPNEYYLKSSNVNNFISNLSKIDKFFQEKIYKIQKKGKVLRYIGLIDVNGKCSVNIMEVNTNDPLYSVKNGENALAFYTQYYQPIPLVLRGYGAGNNVTAAGVFSDILRTLS